ncbi:MAG: CbtB-domain containing protein [Candidatus Rokubacteria bacterium]|nr:CbtB-domain containing protein [Candidatus Rokubacteria bacterium]
MAHVQTPKEGHRAALIGAFLLGALGLYVLALDQGFVLSVFQGDIAFDMNLLHELVHDARHTAGFPCH